MTARMGNWSVHTKSARPYGEQQPVGALSGQCGRLVDNVVGSD